MLRDFAFALLVGVVTGTYSSIAAASLVMDWETWSRARARAGGKVPGQGEGLRQKVVAKY